MKKSDHFSKYFCALLFILLSQFIVTSASANSTIMSSAISKGIKVTDCSSCHTSTSGTQTNVKPSAQTAYNLDKTGLTRLKNLINGCPTGTALNPTTFLCAAAGAPKIVWSAVSSSVGLSTSGAARTDVYAVTCGTGTAKLSVAVKDLPPVKAAVVSIQAAKGFLASPLSADAVDGDAAGAASPAVTLAAGAGIYNVLVNKQLSAAKGAELYIVQYACLNAAGKKTATSAAVTKQNQ